MWPDNEARSNDDQPQPSPYFQPPAPQEPMREIGSAPVENLTSGGLLELRQVIAEAQTQRAEINGDLKEAQSQHEREIKELERRSRSIFRYFYKRRIALLKGTLSAIAAEIERLSEWRESTHVDINFETSDRAKQGLKVLLNAFDWLRSSQSIWDGNGLFNLGSVDRQEPQVTCLSLLPA